MSRLHYLAYGSNLHPIRLAERVPSARLVGITEITGYRLTFHKRSKDGSAKCNLVDSGRLDSRVFGAIYEINADEKPALDKAEGAGYGYLETEVTVHHDDVEYTCFAYLAQRSHISGKLKPYHWYKQLVVTGAEYLGFPGQYIESIIAVESEQDPDLARREKNAALLQRMSDLPTSIPIR